MRQHEKKWALARLAAAMGVAAALAATPALAFAEEAEGGTPEGEALELVAQVDDPVIENQVTVNEPVATITETPAVGDDVLTNDVTNETNGVDATRTEGNDGVVSTDVNTTMDDNAVATTETTDAGESTLAAQAEPRQGHWVVTDSYGQGLQRYFVWDDDGSLATSELVGPDNGAGYYAYATADGYILRGKWDSGAGRVYVADNDGRLVGSLLSGDTDGWVVTNKFDKGSMQRYWVDAKTRAAYSGFFTVEGYGDCFGRGGQGYVARGDFKFGSRLWSADNDGKLRSGWYVTKGFGQGTQRYWMGDIVYGSPHAAAVSRLIDASTDSKAWFAWATEDGYVLRGKWDNGDGRVYVADNDGRLLGSDLDADGFIVTADYDGKLQRYYVDATMRAAMSGFFTIPNYGDCFGLGGQGYVLRGTRPWRDAVILANNDGKLPSEAGWLVTKDYGQGQQRYWIEIIYETYLGSKPGYSEDGYAHYTLASGYVQRNSAFVVSVGVGYETDNDGLAIKLPLGWSKLRNGHWFYLSDDARACFENDIDEDGNDLGHYDILHDIWLKVNGYVSGSHQSYLSKTGYLICSCWDSCYIGIFKGEANTTKSDNWEPLFGWNCANGLPSKIEEDYYRINGKSSYKWDPNWDRFLAEGNVASKMPDALAGTWTAKLNTTWSGSRVRKVNANEQYFTSVLWDLGYHTYLKSETELGKHLSYGCQRLTYEHAQWIYENIGPGTRCIQLSYYYVKNAK